MGVCKGGLSPRVRGNPATCVKAYHLAGSIPACAGEPTGNPPMNVAAAVYPRVCGGTGSERESSTISRGLSPRVRGNLRGFARGHWFLGSIPACAGEPPFIHSFNHSSRVYPRVCGGTMGAETAEHIRQGLSPRVRGNPILAMCVLIGMGLSPRVRGNLTPCYRKVVVDGSIPACAGEPASRAWEEPDCRVYPRVCGGTWPRGR